MSTPSGAQIQTVETLDKVGPFTPADYVIDDVGRERLERSVPENTTRAYDFVYRRFDTWCTEQRRSSLPATPETLFSYVSNLITLQQAPASISQHIGAIRKRHSIHGYDGQPNSEAALQILKGYRRERAQEGISDREAPPLLQPELRAMLAVLDPTKAIAVRDHLLLVLGFAMMARRSELAALTFADVKHTSEGIDIMVRTSKTDKDSRGAVCSIPNGEKEDLDPIRHLARWRAVLAEHAVLNDGPLLRRVDRWGNPTASIKPDTVNAIVQALAYKAELPDAGRYSAHSLRAGGLTAALMAGKPLGIAAKHGRWSPNSPVVLRYARMADRFRDNAMRGVV